MDVEPSFANISEAGLDYFLEATDPTLLTSVKLDLSDAGSLNLLEFFNSESLTLD